MRIQLDRLVYVRVDLVEQLYPMYICEFTSRLHIFLIDIKHKSHENIQNYWSNRLSTWIQIRRPRVQSAGRQRDVIREFKFIRCKNEQTDDATKSIERQFILKSTAVKRCIFCMCWWNFYCFLESSRQSCLVTCYARWPVTCLVTA